MNKIYNVAIVSNCNGLITFEAIKSFLSYDLATNYIKAVYNSKIKSLNEYSEITKDEYCLEGFEVECEWFGIKDGYIASLTEETIIQENDAPYSLYVNCECVGEFNSLEEAKSEANFYLEENPNALIDVYSFNDYECKNAVWWKNE